MLSSLKLPYKEFFNKIRLTMWQRKQISHLIASNRRNNAIYYNIPQFPLAVFRHSFILGHLIRYKDLIFQKIPTQYVLRCWLLALISNEQDLMAICLQRKTGYFSVSLWKLREVGGYSTWWNRFALPQRRE